MIRPLSAAALLLLTAACLPDDLVGDQRSPDGALVARAWCIDMCDTPEGRTVTISEASATEGTDAPGRDIAARVYITPKKGSVLVLRWTGARALTISGPCLAGLDFQPLRPRRFRDVSLSFVRSPGEESCWQVGGGRG